MASDVAHHSELDLPKELWIEIVLEIAPRDAVALSQVCQLLHDLLSDRDLWIKVLRAVVCQRDGIFSGTYPVADMDLGQIQLHVDTYHLHPAPRLCRR
ncbi:hypothetical protein FA13DRAFT_1741406 [Coprinellus micaceus]|uniref:F-box domain-containing protein n=1 Tax=Coprinellus micaceus TaxID=71717 RepID=A0A4Y7SJD5_COPMI|nr:hypothetical protein FA13DRAFT_1741406 [Coprinellus micaceus]